MKSSRELGVPRVSVDEEHARPGRREASGQGRREGRAPGGAVRADDDHGHPGAPGRAGLRPHRERLDEQLGGRRERSEHGHPVATPTSARWGASR